MGNHNGFIKPNKDSKFPGIDRSIGRNGGLSLPSLSEREKKVIEKMEKNMRKNIKY
ncbi:hypothetical protein [Clostridium sp. WB02_MRS01]|uniref:hypothetical protein n=1 Tax=Clostridium sp. WB02_MRS01 TaxID=2605777 RepID=UPI0012B24D79|nr:hypothetical protein [Clostridium sp. WB02_MRS01]